MSDLHTRQLESTATPKHRRNRPFVSARGNGIVPVVTPSALAAVRFGRCELQPRERRLLVDGAPVKLAPRALDLLIVLAQHIDTLMYKDALLDLAWPGVIVEESNLHVQISALRKVLGRDLIKTVPGYGYRLEPPRV